MRSYLEVVCGGVGRGKSVLQTGTTRSREVSARIGVTSDEAENAPRLRVANGDDSQGVGATSEAPSRDTHRQRSG